VDLLTRTEEIILLAVYRLEGDAYGVTIRRDIEETTGKKFSVGAIYVPLERLTNRGLLTSHVGEPTAERGGRGKRFYRVTPEGLKALQEVQQLNQVMWRGLPDFQSAAPIGT
jgi:PadR family transcriptional regulator PadR